MGKRKRSGKANGQNANNNKRARIVDIDDSDAENQQTTGVLPVTFAPGESPEEKETLLSNKTLFASDLSRADHDRERRLYKLLGSADVEDRIRAADVIVSALLGGSETESESVSEAVLLRHLERRLLRGLASGSEASRVGFSYVLSELLGQLFGRKGEDITKTAEAKKKDYAAAYPNLTFDKLLDLLLEKTKPAANLPGQEERDHYWGLLFGLQSFVESGILFGPGDNGRVSFWDSLLERLLQLGHKKVWLRSQACFVVVQAIARGRLPDEAIVTATLQTVANDATGGDGSSSSLAKTPEGLGIWLAALARFPEMALPAPWTSPLAPGSHKDVVAVLKNSGSDDEAGPKTKQGNASAQLHFVWDLLLGELLVGGAAKRFDAFWVAVVDQVYFAKGASDHQKLTGFKVFQKALALCTAMADKATDASDVEAAVRPSLFSNNLMTCLMNQASNPTPRLHRAAVQVLKVIERQVEENPRILAPVLACLLGSAPQSHGVYEFDERVKGTGDGTRPVEKILRFADSESIDEVVRLLRSGALQAPDANSDQKPFRIYAEYLFRLVSRAGAETAAAASQTGEVSVSSIAFQALAELAYPAAGTAVVASTTEATNGDKKKKKSKSAATTPVADAFPELNEKTLAAARKSLLSAAGALLKRPDDFASFCRTVRAIEPESVGVDMTGEIKERVLAARQQLKQLLAAFDAPTKVSKKKSDAAAASRARQGLAVLLAVSLLQLYHEPRADAIEVLDDIQACGDKLTAALARSGGKKEKESKEEMKKGKKSKKAEVNSDEEEEDHEHGEPDIGQVLTEVLLALLAESSQLTRQTSLQVFEAFTPFMSAEALDNLTDVLAAEENTSGYRTLFNQEGEDEEEDSGDEDGEGDDDDDDDDNSVVMMDMDADGDVTALAEGVKSSDEEEDSDDSDDSDSDEDDDEEEAKPKGKANGKKADDAADDSLEAALRKTYGDILLEEGDDKEDAKEEEDDDSDNESDMSDDAMLRLDDHLAGHLALIRNKTDSHKKERDEARKRVVGFKHRVLDLVETYVKKAPSDSSTNLLLLFRLLLPLVVLVRDTKEPALAQKAARIVQEVPKQLKKGRSSSAETSSTAVDLDDATAILEELHVAANDKTESRAFAAAVSTASLAIASTLWAATAAGSDERTAAYQRVADVYRSTQDRWVLDGWSVRTSLFTDWYNWCQNAARGSSA